MKSGRSNPAEGRGGDGGRDLLSPGHREASRCVERPSPLMICGRSLINLRACGRPPPAALCWRSSGLRREASQPVAVSPLMFDSGPHDYDYLAGGGEGGGGRRWKRWRDLVAHEPLITEQHQGPVVSEGRNVFGLRGGEDGRGGEDSLSPSFLSRSQTNRIFTKWSCSHQAKLRLLESALITSAPAQGPPESRRVTYK